jgi:hypothetical protein
MINYKQYIYNYVHELIRVYALIHGLFTYYLHLIGKIIGLKYEENAPCMS